MGISTELTFTIILMVIIGIVLFLFIVKHLKKLAVITIAILTLVGARAGYLGYLQHTINLAKEKAYEIGDKVTDAPDDLKTQLDEHLPDVEVPDAEDVRLFHYYELDTPGFGIPSKEQMDKIEDKAEEYFGE